MRILIAEDDPVSRQQMKKFLSKFEHAIVSAENGLQAWEYFKENAIDMVITDWMMPGLDGLDLCKMIRSVIHEKYVYIIILSAKDQKRDLIEILDAGADDYITKPFDPEEFRVRIQTGERILKLESEHTQLVNTLTESRNRLRAVFDALSEEIISIDNEFKIVSMNKTFLNNERISYADFGNTPYFQGEIDSLRLFNDGKVTALAKKVFETGTAQHSIETDMDMHGEKTYREIRCLPLTDENSITFQVIIVCKNITEEKRKSEEIESLNSRLQEAIFQINSKNEKLEQALNSLKNTQAQILQSEKMSSIGQLAAGIAHEINNPTGYVSSNLKTLTDYHEDIKKMLTHYKALITSFQTTSHPSSDSTQIADQVKHIINEYHHLDMDYILQDASELIEESKEGVERIKKIVMDLKDFAHPGVDEMKLTDINRNIDSTLNIVWNEIKYKALVKKDYGDLPQVKCYPQQLNQVFMNILINAAQAVRAKGVICISTFAENGRVLIRISDTGEGIPKENIPKIFDPFFTTKEVGKGTGLGMNVVYNIIKKHNGTIDVDSEIGKGSTFTIQIPIDQVFAND